MEEIEIEFKNVLTRKQYENLRSSFDVDTFSHISYYFDFNNILKEHQIALRVRVKDNSYRLTIKHQFDKHIYELKDDISFEEFESLKNGYLVNDLLNKYLISQNIIIDKYELIAVFTTNRSIFYIDDYKIFLDETIFSNNEVDYELEIECCSYDDGLKFFELFLKKYNINKIQSNKKIARALEKE